MIALELQGENQMPQLVEVNTPTPVGKEVLVTMKAAALNHRDVWISKGKYPGINYPIILGSDGAGWLGEKRIIVQPGMNWGEDERVQSKSYQILGLPANGTFAEFSAVDSRQIFAMPEHLSFEEAAALPLAGMTAFRVLFARCQAMPGERILITGIGGGVAVCCLQFALAAGLEVYVTSSSDSKIEKAVSMGASGAANYANSDWAARLKEQAGSFDIIIDSAGGEGFTQLVKLCAPGGRIGIYGGTRGVIPSLSPQLIFWRQISILGSTMGSDKDFSEMLAFVCQYKITPVIDSVFPIAEGRKAFERLESGKQFGKVVLKIN